MMKRLAPLFLLVVAGCSSDDNTSSFCEEVQQKSNSCNMNVIINCSAADASDEQMKVATRECLLNQDCSVWQSYAVGYYMTTDVITCFANNGVQFTASSIYQCADGSGVVPVEVKCNGTNNCPDGSDETGC